MSKGAIVIGVTGGFGTGKSTVAGMFKKFGAVVINADRIAHDVILPGGDIYKKIVSLFGEAILKKNKRIDRKKLGGIVFNNKRKRSLLNSLIHPEVIKRIKCIIKEKERASEKIYPVRKRHPIKEGSSNGVYIIDVPLLIEAGLLHMVDKLIVVTASRKTQIARCKRIFGIKQSDILKRIRSQMPLSKKRQLADFIIDNNGSFNSTRRKVEKVWREIKNG